MYTEFHETQARRGQHATDAEQQELLSYVETRLRDHQAQLRAAKQQAKAEARAAGQQERMELLELREFYLVSFEKSSTNARHDTTPRL